MKKIYFGFLILTVALFSTIGVRAQGVRSPDEDEQRVPEVKQKMLENFRQRQVETKQKIEQRRVEFTQKLQLRQASSTELQTTRRTALVERLKMIKDEQKQQRALRINDQLQQINRRLVEQMSKILDRQNATLQRLIERINLAENAGQDVSQSRALSTQAQAAMETAREALVNQTAKIYTMEIKTEATLKADMGATRQTMQNDLKAVRETVKNVHEALRLVFTNLVSNNKII